MKKKPLLFASMYILVYGVWFFVFRENMALRMYGNNVFSLAGAAVSMYWMFRAYRGIPDKRKYMWLLMCGALLFYFVGQCLWIRDVAMYGRYETFSSWEDLLWLLEYLTYLLALIYQLTLIGRASRIRSIFNTVIVMTIVSAFSFHFLIKPLMGNGSDSPIAVVISIVYPTLGLGNLCAALCLFYNSKYRVQRNTALIVLCSFIIQNATDSMYAYLYATGTYTNGILDPVYLIPMFLNGLAADYALRHRDELANEPIGDDDWASGREYGWSSYVSFIVLFVIVIACDEDIDALVIGLFTAMLLIVIRQVAVLKDNRSLLQQIKTKHEELVKSEERYRTLVEISPNAICVESGGTIVYMNKAGLELYGAASADQLVGKSVRDIVSPDLLATVQKRQRQVAELKRSAEPIEYATRRLDGKLIHIESSLAEITYNGTTAYLSVAQDITPRKKNEEYIKRLAYYDPLTELPNRVMFRERLSRLLEAARDNNELVAVLFVDLDRFKFINDSMGHSFGDLFLKQVAQCLKMIIAGSGTLYRHGGDEFCVLLEQASPDKAGTVAEQMIYGLSAPFVIDGREYFTTPSIGISLYPNDGEDRDTLVRFADIAMYKAKRQGGNTYQFYIPALDRDNGERMDVEHALRRAIESEQFLVYYQPQVNLHTGDIVGLEALVRWLHPERGLVPPAEFIAIAEETGLIVPLGRWVLKTACRQMKDWHNDGFTALKVAVNISPRQFKDKDLPRTVAQVLQETRLDPRQLEIEVTESVMHNIKESSAVLTELKRLGVQISIDDFGIGYSSLSCLKHLPIDHLKVDKSFVDDITVNPKDEAIIKTIVDMGHHLEFNVVAEGIENEQQLRSLMEHRCNIGQGYLFSRPLPADQVERLFTASYADTIGRLAAAGGPTRLSARRTRRQQRP